MSDKSRQKQRKRLKREKKKQELRRMQSISPYRAIGRQGEVVTCRVNADWRERGQAAGYVLRRGAGGKLGFATFLVDLWCAGLKDIWGRLDILLEDFDDITDRMSAQMDDSIVDCDLSEVAGILAGGIRFAIQNGFRLPSHYQRWCELFGPIDAKSADLTYFGFEGGKLHFEHEVNQAIDRLTPEAKAELARADEQITHYMKQFKSPEEMFRAMDAENATRADIVASEPRPKSDKS